MSSTLQSALATLNPAQRVAVLHDGSPLLILAGAGSGKTRVVTVKIAWLIAEQGIDPRSILAVTFTNKAAGEMRERALALLADHQPPIEARDVTLKTFHSFGAWMLRRNADVAGLPRGFTIYDDDDSITLLKSLYPEQKRSELSRWYHLISRAKDYCLTPDDDLEEVSADPEFPRVYRAYQDRLREIGNVDFGDLIQLPMELLEREPSVAARLHRRFRYLLVDEYQDANVAQYRFLRALVGPEAFVCVVGDDDQSIYRFRGAEVQNILTFPERFPETKVVRLEQNYRSTAPILDLAGAVVSNNEGRLGKTLFTDRSGGKRPALILFGDQDEEVSWTIERIREVLTRGESGETAILYRTNAQSRVFETALLREAIPYRIVGAVRFWQREEIKDAVALLKLVANPRDEVAFRRVVNKPTRGIGAKSLDKIMETLPAAGGDVERAANYALPALSKRAARALSAFLGVVEAIRRMVNGSQHAVGEGEEPPSVDAARMEEPLSRVVESALVESGLLLYHREQDEVGGTQKVQNLEELVNAASLHAASEEGLSEFLEAIELDGAREQEDAEQARVVLITMHNTKGLEFDRVIITGLEEGLFPRDDDPDELEEERRLFYVAITRARNELTLTSCRSRRIHGRIAELYPSRFLTEIPQELMDVTSGDGGHSPVVGTLQGLCEGRRAGQEHPWPRGTGVYHDDYGSGAVIQAWHAGGEAVVLVRFETGATAQFIPKYTPLERLGARKMEDEW